MKEQNQIISYVHYFHLYNVINMLVKLDHSLNLIQYSFLIL